MTIDYLEDGDLAVFKGYKFRLDKKTGYYLSSRNIEGKRKRLHVYMWEYHNGQVPKGLSIHHKDEDKSNNVIENLKLMTNKKHAKYHADEFVKSNYESMVINLQENALPKAIKWHKSEEGSEWHKEHYENTRDRFQVIRYFSCESCGKDFESTQTRSRFCSNKCKSQFRRDSGVDDIVKICEKCGKEYTANKYQRTKYCKLCKS